MPALNSAIGHLPPATAMVIGGGIGGMRAALDLADAGLKVFLVEHSPCLGGRVAQLGFMFPQHDCVLCRGTSDHGYGCTRPSISPSYISHNQHPNIEVLTNTQVIEVSGEAGDFTVALRQAPRIIDSERCINCDECARVCPVEMPNTYQNGLTMRKAAYKVSARANPDAYVIERGPYCEDCRQCEGVCPTHAIHLDEKPRLISLEIGAIILALGFQVFDPTPLQEFGYSRYPNVIQAMQYERLASRSGPTEGIILRPSDGLQPKSIAWLQCIGSRDSENSYCSSICCMYATKEAILAKQRLGEALNCDVFIMDERAFNKEYSTYFSKARHDHNIHFHRCRVSSVQEDPDAKDLILQYANADGKFHQERYQMVVLATGLQPPKSASTLAQILDIELNEFGFCQTDKYTPLQTSRPGVFVCGAFSSPKEIAETIIDASGAAAEVMRLLNDRLNVYPYSRAWPFLTDQEMPPERDTLQEDIRIGVFGCTCANTLDGDVNLDVVLAGVESWAYVEHVELVQTACFPETVSDLGEKILEKGLNRIVLAACSNRTHESLFQRMLRQVGLNPYLIEMINLREQCSHVHVQQKHQVNRKARELVRMAVERVRVATPIHKTAHPCIGSALVIGGGVAGMSAALAIADSGYDVHLVERSQRLGGNLLDLYYVAEGYNPQRLLRDLVNRIRAHQRISAHTRTQVVSHAGHVGQFQAELVKRRANGIEERINIRHGVTIIATGAQEGRNHPLLKLSGVITQRELEDKIIQRPQDIAELKQVVMINCVQPEGTPSYCSRVCCTNAIKNAIRLKLYNPDCQVIVLSKNIVTYGFREEFYTEARSMGVVFMHYEEDQFPLVMEGEKRLLVKSFDSSLAKELTFPADLIVLSMSILPSPGTQDIAHMMRLPLSTEGFYKEAQIKLRPMDFMREGIFLAGMAHYPKFIEESISHALAAAARALTLLSQGVLYLGGVVAEVDPSKCVGCLTCTRVCPFSIPQVIVQEGRNGVGGIGGAAFIDSAQCQGCGTCTGECPANAIQLNHYTDEQMMLPSVGGLGSWLPGEENRTLQPYQKMYP